MIFSIPNTVMRGAFGADRALVLRTEPLRVSALTGFDHGYGRPA
jgi:hypothetical protein